MQERACTLVREWAEKLLGINFSGMDDLANYLIDKLYVDQRSKSVAQWNDVRCHQNDDVDADRDVDGDNCQKKSGDEIGDNDKDHMRELKRKLQVIHSSILVLRQLLFDL